MCEWTESELFWVVSEDTLEDMGKNDQYQTTTKQEYIQGWSYICAQSMRDDITM